MFYSDHETEQTYGCFLGCRSSSVATSGIEGGVNQESNR